MNENILPCPFCGKRPESFPSGDGSGLMIHCITQGCVNPHVSFIPPSAAVNVWNKRNSTAQTDATHEAFAAANDLLREALSDYGHPRFTDRHGMADRLRAYFKKHSAALKGA